MPILGCLEEFDRGLEFTAARRLFLILAPPSRRSLASLPGPRILELFVAMGQSEGLLVESLHDLLDPGQVGATDGEVARAGAHLVAHLAFLTGEAVALSSGCYSVLSRVQ